MATPITLTGWFRVLRVTPSSSGRDGLQHIDIRYFHDRSVETMAISKYAMLVGANGITAIPCVTLDVGEWYRACIRTSPMHGRYIQNVQESPRNA